ncbi:hypothetical protein H0X48_00960 [Candidatus Dependentiae bacterium]|nr:hypothetical protein [Candidatus Dependentiae bacterium]
MYRIGRDGLDINKIGVKENDVTVFVFGEVDARVHILKQANEKKCEIKVVVKELVSSYIKSIIQNKSVCKSIKTIIMAVVPPTQACGLDNIPIFGTIEERINIVRLLNKNIHKECSKYNLIMLDVNDLYSKNNILDPELSDSCNHINMAYNDPIKKRLIDIIAS